MVAQGYHPSFAGSVNKRITVHATQALMRDTIPKITKAKKRAGVCGSSSTVPP
jgi:hypothetical protein